MVRIPGNVPAALKRARLVEMPSAVQFEDDEPIPVTLVLNRDREKAFERYLKEIYQPHSPNYRHFLAQREIADRFGPSRAEYEQVLNYMRSSGFKLLQGSKNRLTLEMRGTRAMAERAFDVDIHDYRLGKRKFHANDLDPALPATIAPHVQAIVGLSNLARPQHVGAGDITNSTFARQTNALVNCFAPPLSIGPRDWTDLAQALAPLTNEASLIGAVDSVTAPVACELNMIAAYAVSYGSFPDPTPGTGQRIGLVEFDNYYTSDVQNYLNLIGAGGQISQLSEVDVAGGAGAPGPGESEVLLDIDIAMRLAPGANVAVYDAPFTGAGSFQSVFSAMINNTTNPVTVISNSWATCEDQEPPADLTSLNSVLATAAAGGITVITGSGDSGSTCLDGAPNTVSVPADSPNDTAVGGTTATANVAGAYESEQWWDGTSHTPPTGEGGFGVSNFFGPVSYQLPLLTSAIGRSVPDVVSPADPAQGWMICEADKGGCPAPLLFGGTSAAAPIWASFIAVLNQELGRNLGFLNPTLYSLAGTNAFHSPASMGTDFAHVGLGSPNVNELRRLLAGGTTGAVNLANSGIVVPPVPVVADGTSEIPVSVTLLDSNFYTVSGQTVTLTADVGSSAVITTVRGTTDLSSGAALFEVSDTVPETVTLTAMVGGTPLPSTATLTFVSPPATGGSIQTSTPSVLAGGGHQATITVTLAGSTGASVGKRVSLSQGNGSSQISSTNATTDSNGVATFTATDNVVENVTYTAIDITDGNLPIPGSATVDFTGTPSTPPCNVGLGTVASGYAVSTFASGFPFTSCVGPVGLAFDPRGNLLVNDYQDNDLYKFPPLGGAAGGGTEIGPTSLCGATGLVYTADGRLYAAAQCNSKIVELDPETGAVLRNVASVPCATGLAVDPISGNVFASEIGCGYIVEITNITSTTPTVTTFANNVHADGITFGPDGTLYAAWSGNIYTIDGTNSSTPGNVVATTAVAGTPDGVAVANNPSDPLHPFLFVNGNTGTIVKIDTSTNTETTIYSGGSRGDFVTVGPDGCMYATQTDRILKITNADGSCPFSPVAVAPAIALKPAVVSPNPTQGSTVRLSVQLQNVTNLANVPVQLVVGGANPLIYAGSSDANGQVIFNLTGIHSGLDEATAVASPNGTALTSNLVEIDWVAGAHNTFISLNQDPEIGFAGKPLTLTGTLVDVSANPNAPLGGQTLSFNLDGQICSGTTDSTGTATCTVTPTATGTFTLTTSFAGDNSYVASSATKRVLVTTFLAPVSCLGPTISATLLSGSTTPLAGSTGSWTFEIEVCPDQELTDVSAQGGTNGWVTQSETSWEQSRGSVTPNLKKKGETLTWNIGDMSAGTAQTLDVTVTGTVSAHCGTVQYLNGPWSAVSTVDGTTSKSAYTSQIAITSTCISQ